MSLKHICRRVSDIIGVEVKFVEDCVGEEAEKAVADLQEGEVLLLENLRFHSEETSGDVAFAKQLSKLGDSFVCKYATLYLNISNKISLSGCKK